jgi:hypothetical protein
MLYNIVTERNIMETILRQKISNLLEKLPVEDITILEEMLNNCGEYIEKVNRMGNAWTVVRYRMDTNNFQEYYSSIDKSRTSIHNDLIIKVKMINRLCKIHSVESIFTGNTDERIEVAEFAMEVVTENFTLRKK